jgi:hypothetical protein
VSLPEDTASQRVSAPTSALDIQFLNARQGDAIWIRWGADRQMMIDMGTHGTGLSIAKRLRDVSESRRHFDLLVVTHVDTDHIGGVLSCVAQPERPVPGLGFRDVWFNGWEHLNGNHTVKADHGLEPLGGVQGEAFSSWLREQAWNEAFRRGPVVRSDLTPIDMGDGLTLIVLGPSQARLTALKRNWKTDVQTALEAGRLTEVSPGLEKLGPTTPPDFEDRFDLEILADEAAPADTSAANGSSITLLLEWEGRRILLTGDAFADELQEGLAAVNHGQPVEFDLVKAPHHGSRQNMTRELAELVDCPVWVFSSDGTTYRHPDAQAIARILQYGRRPKPTLAFTVRSTFSGWWDNDRWRGLYGYQTLYGTAEDGLTFDFEPT